MTLNDKLNRVAHSNVALFNTLKGWQVFGACTMEDEFGDEPIVGLRLISPDREQQVVIWLAQDPEFNGPGWGHAEVFDPEDYQ